MVQHVGDDRGTQGGEVSEAFAVARQLLQQAEADAARLRTDADRYARQREQEAELLVAKARRLLEVAEGRAASVSAAARAPQPAPRHLLVEAQAVAPTIDLDPLASPPDPAEPQPTRIRSDLDRMLADAIAKAFDGSFPAWP